MSFLQMALHIILGIISHPAVHAAARAAAAAATREILKHIQSASKKPRSVQRVS